MSDLALSENQARNLFCYRQQKNRIFGSFQKQSRYGTSTTAAYSEYTCSGMEPDTPSRAQLAFVQTRNPREDHSKFLRTTGIRNISARLSLGGQTGSQIYFNASLPARPDQRPKIHLKINIIENINQASFGLSASIENNTMNNLCRLALGGNSETAKNLRAKLSLIKETASLASARRMSHK